MAKVREPLNGRELHNHRRSTMPWKHSRLHSSTPKVYPLLVCLCLASPLWCTSSSAQLQPVSAPTMPPTLGPTLAPAPAPLPVASPTDPDTMDTLYKLETWPDVWRQRGTVPNISDLTIPNRDPCIAKWVGIYCDNGSPFQFILNITVVDVEGGFPNNFLGVMSNILSLRFLRIYQKGDKARSSLTGTIPASLSQLVNLEEINFRGNQLTGEVPVEIARLPNLLGINLADNQLTGSIEQFCESKSLKNLSLLNNHFSGSLPACLGRLNLTNLIVGFNNFTGVIPESFGNLANMEIINVDNVTLAGGLPDTMVAKWAQLTSLSFRRSNLSGPIPPALGSLKKLQLIMLGQNEFSGSIPKSLGGLESLLTLALYENNLTGVVPSELGGMKNLTHLLLANNSLSGEVPASLGSLSKLQHLHLQGNKFSGAIRGGMFANLTGLKGLFLQENNFNGTFPSHEIFNSCMSLVNVSVSYNQFTGPVLEPETTLPFNLSFLLMSYNNFSGPIPRAIGETMNNLHFLDLANNSLSGEVPTEVTSKTITAQINLSFNKLNVTKHPTQPGFGLFNCLPQDVNCTEYQAGNNNQITINVGGPEYYEYNADVITPEFSIGMFKPTSAKSTWFLSTTGVDGGGMLNRTQTLTNADSIEHWPLYNTARIGADSFTYYIHSLVPGKYEVALGFVELIADMRVGERVFDIRIQGKLVHQGMDVVAKAPGHFRAFVETFHVEISGLLTIELRGHGSWPLVFNKRTKQGYYYGPILSSLKVYQVHELSKLAKIGIIVGAAAGGVLVTIALVLLGIFYVRRQRKLQELKDEHSGLGLKFFRFSELEAATNKWSAKSLLGEGAFGKVYRGILQDGTIVAIKQLSTKTDGPFSSKESFINEAKIISTTRHRNLIALLGCCFETSNPMFICEYMPSGSLHDALFVNQVPLNWTQRVAIARDVASGLLYLHEETVNRIIHRDVKPANILLDEKMNARVADFGLARLVADQEIDVVTNVMGTRGYLAPEYALNGQLSDKVDVYSYGVVLLELVSGRHGLQPSLDLPEPVPISMVQWVWDMVTAGKVLGVADAVLDHGFFNEDFIRMVEIGLWCTQSHPDLRPTMNQVSRMLHKQARVPKLVEHRTSYEGRDMKNLPANPFDAREWSSYVSEAPVGNGKKDSPISSDSAKSKGSEAESFDHSACQVSGLLPR